MNLEKAKEMLITGGYTCVIYNGEKSYTSNERGVKPLLSLAEKKIVFEGFSAADKVIGKATAFLYLKLKVTEVYAAVISRPALSLLISNGIAVQYDTLVDNIINRKGDGICPFEAAVIDYVTAEEAYSVILHKASLMGI